MIRNESLVGKLTKDYREAELDEKDQAMLKYAAKLTVEPWNMSNADVENLRSAGFNDSAILDICQITGYYAFVNRLADGLGVELEDYWDEKKLNK